MSVLSPLLGMVRRRPWLVVSLSVLMVVLACLAAARLWIGSSGGRAFIESQIDGRKAGSFGRIDIEGLSGDPLDRFGAARITLTDAEGVWLSIEDVDLAWSPARLMSRTVKLDLVSAGKVDIRRRPVTETRDKQTDGSSGDWAVSLDQLKIDELLLQEGVAGPRAVFTIDGRFRLPKEKTFDLSVTALPLEGVGDRIDATLKRAVSGAYRLDTEIKAPAGGTLASLAGLPEGESAQIIARASGTLREGDGFAEVSLSGETVGEITGKISDSDLRASANVNGSRLPLPDNLTKLIGPQASMTLDATIGKRNIPFDVSAAGQAGTVAAGGTYRRRTSDFDGPVSLDVAFDGLKELSDVDARISFQGTVDGPIGSPVLAGTASLAAAADSGLPFERLEGPVTVQTDGSDVDLTASLAAAGLLKSNSTARRILGSTPRADIAARYNRDSGLLTLSPSTARLARGAIAANGTVDTRARTLNLVARLDGVSGFVASAPSVSASGSVRLAGNFSAPGAVTDLTIRNLETLNTTLAELLGSAPRLKATAEKSGDAFRILSATLEGEVVSATASGQYTPSGPVAIRGRFTQAREVTLSGTEIDLSGGSFDVSGSNGMHEIRLTSDDGNFQRSGIDIDALTTDVSLSRREDGWAGPIAVAGLMDTQPVQITAGASWQSGIFALRDIRSDYESAQLSGELSYGGDTGLDLDIDLAGDRFAFGDRRIGAFDIRLAVDRAPDTDVSIIASGQVADIWLSPSLRFDSVDGQVRNAPEGYNFTVQLKRSHDTRPTDLSLMGEASFSAEYTGGQIELDGTLLGEQVRSIQPVNWQLGDTPAIEAHLALFGGTIRADISEDDRNPRLGLSVDEVDLAPLFASAGLATRQVMVNGQGEFDLFGANPTGQFDLVVAGPLPGLERTLAVDVTGRLRDGALRVTGDGDYGALHLDGTAVLPVRAQPDRMARLDLDQPVSGTARLAGDLSDLRSLALAYGHDLGGTIDASASLSGSLRQPRLDASADVTDGIYEFGATSLRLVDLDLATRYADQVLTVNGTGKGAEGGTARVSGKVSGESTDLRTDFTDLLVYDRDGDSLVAGGEVTITGTPTGRDVSGTVTVQSARFNLDNLPSSRAQAIDVHWKENGDEPSAQSALRQSLTLDIKITADRRVYVDGRGLESEWGADLKLSGTAASPRLNGTATMRRGTLDLAGRPFVFDSGTITFDGPIQRARLDIEADRTVNGFEAKVNLTGSPTNPSIELSSSPDLPEDEILSRLLFGRSSVDLSALEAAQLANSIARLSGNGSGFDPTSQIQAALGVDRLSFGTSEEGTAQVGVGQYIAEDVYLELNSAGAAGSSVEVEWEPRPQVSVTSETTTDGEAKLSVEWKKDY